MYHKFLTSRPGWQPGILYHTFILDCTQGANALQPIVDRDNRRELAKVRRILSDVSGKLPHREIVGPAIISAAELALHKVRTNVIDNTIPVPIQTSQMTVYPELAFQLMILRDFMEEKIRPVYANETCIKYVNDDLKRYCGDVQYTAKISRQTWNWMSQLLVVRKADDLRGSHQLPRIFFSLFSNRNYRWARRYFFLYF